VGDDDGRGGGRAAETNRHRGEGDRARSAKPLGRWGEGDDGPTVGEQPAFEGVDELGTGGRGRAIGAVRESCLDFTS
jgi:hypothetical protein